MIRSLQTTLQCPAWRRMGCAAMAVVLLLAALITPWGLVSSHGTAVPSAAVHDAAWDEVESHGHHAGDHTHDTAHALPRPPLTLSASPPAWVTRFAATTTSPDLAGLERPPKG